MYFTRLYLALRDISRHCREYIVVVQETAENFQAGNYCRLSFQKMGHVFQGHMEGRIVVLLLVGGGLVHINCNYSGLRVAGLYRLHNSCRQSFLQMKNISLAHKVSMKFALKLVDGSQGHKGGSCFVLNWVAHCQLHNSDSLCCQKIQHIFQDRKQCKKFSLQMVGVLQADISCNGLYPCQVERFQLHNSGN